MLSPMDGANVEANSRRLDIGPSEYIARRIVLRFCFTDMTLVTPDLTYPLIHQLLRILGKISIQTRYSVVDETKQGLKDGIARIMREELGKLRNEMRNMVMTNNTGVMVGMQNMAKFGGTNIKGWLHDCERFFQVNNVPDEHKVSLISNHLFDIALIWHKKFVSIMGENVNWMIYKDAILRLFGNSIDGLNVQFLSNGVKDSCFNLLDKLKELSVNHSHIVGKNIGANKMFDEMPIRNNFKQEGVKEASEVIDENIGLMGFDGVFRECDQVGEFELKDSSEVHDGCFVGINNIVKKVDMNVDINSFDHTSFVLVEIIKESLEVENEVSVDKKVSEDIKTIDVLRSGGFEIVKSGLEKWTRHGVNNMEGKVGVSDLWKYETRLIRVKDSLLFGLHFNNGEFNLTTNQVFDPGGKQVFNSGGFVVEKFLINRENGMECDDYIVQFELNYKDVIFLNGNTDLMGAYIRKSELELIVSGMHLTVTSCQVVIQELGIINYKDKSNGKGAVRLQKVVRNKSSGNGWLMKNGVSLNLKLSLILKFSLWLLIKVVGLLNMLIQVKTHVAGWSVWHMKKVVVSGGLAYVKRGPDLNAYRVACGQATFEGGSIDMCQ
ncbi:hypothetical protein Tco_0151567 [Tanacetum coccineum]